MTTPAAPTIEGGAVVTVNILEAGQLAQCRAAFITIDHTDPSLNDGQSVLDAWWAAFRPTIATDCSCIGGTMRYTRPSSPAFDLVAPPSPVGGGQAGGTSLAPYCGLVKWTTATGGRTGKGRTYVPGVGSVLLATGGRGFTAAAVTAYNLAISNYLDSAALQGPSNLIPGIVSAKDAAIHFITGGSIAAIPGIQRRRMRA